MNQSFDRRFIWLSAFGLIAFAACGSWAQADGTFYRYYFKERLDLTPDQNVFAVRHPGTSPEDVAAAVTETAVGWDTATAFDDWSLFASPNATSPPLLPAGTNDSAESRAVRPALELLPELIGRLGDRFFFAPVFRSSGGEIGWPGDELALQLDPRFDDETAQEILAELNLGALVQSAYGGTRNTYRMDPGLVSGFEALDRANAIAVDDRVLFAEPNWWRYSTDAASSCLPLIPNPPNDPNLGNSWGLGANGVEAIDAWYTCAGEWPEVVAILDNGIDGGHDDLAGNLAPGQTCNPVCAAGGGPFDQGNCAVRAHGTVVGGVAGMVANNGLGSAGTAPKARIRSVRVHEPSGAGSDPCGTPMNSAHVVNGIQWVWQNGGRILNYSYNWQQVDAAITNAYATATAAGTLSVISAGNHPLAVFPAALSSVIAVSASNAAGALWSGSNTGSHINVTAPGEQVFSSDLEGAGGYSAGDYATLNGTSFAAPHVAGTAALIWSLRPFLTLHDVGFLLRSTTTDLGTAGRDNSFGYGLVKADAALARASIYYFGDDFDSGDTGAWSNWVN